MGDFVLKRGDGMYAYQLAVVVDDLAMGITEVVRGADLLSSAPRQVLLAELLGGRAPAFAHVPLIVDADGARLEKRNPRHTLHGLRDERPERGGRHRPARRQPRHHQRRLDERCDSKPAAARRRSRRAAWTP